MSSAIHAIVTIPATSGVPADHAVNTFNFISTADDPGIQEANLCWSAINNFYNRINPPNANAIAWYLSPSISRVTNGAEMAFYQIAEDGSGSIGAPIHTRAWTVGAQGGTGTPFPSECAAALSYRRAAPEVPEHGVGGVRPKARHRGRVFLGPLNNLGMAVVPITNQIILSTAFVQTVNKAGELLSSEAAVSGVAWAVWSRVNNTLYQVNGGWSDNAIDIIRSRGEKATLRTEWGVQPGILDLVEHHLG